MSFDWLRLVMMIAIGGLIGYATNKVAVRMLFRPMHPRKVLFFRFQGLLPKRKAFIAEKMGQTIEAEFLSKDDIFDALLNPETIETIKTTLKENLIVKIRSIIPSMLRTMFASGLDELIENFIDQEADVLMRDVFVTLKEEGLTRLDMPALIKARVDAMDLVAFEKLVLDIVRRELRHIELVGLVLGMFIGAMQFLIFTLF